LGKINANFGFDATEDLKLKEWLSHLLRVGWVGFAIAKTNAFCEIELNF